MLPAVTSIHSSGAVRSSLGSTVSKPDSVAVEVFSRRWAKWGVGSPKSSLWGFIGYCRLFANTQRDALIPTPQHLDSMPSSL